VVSRQALGSTWFVPVAVFALLFSGSSVALAAATGPGGSPVTLASAPRSTFAAPSPSAAPATLGSLGLFDGLPDGFFSSESTGGGSTGGMTTDPEVTLSQAEEDAIIQLVRDEMSPTDQVALDRLLAIRQAEQVDIDSAQIRLSSAEEELNALVDKSLSLQAATTQSTVQSTDATPASTKVRSVVFKVSANWVCPVQGPHSFTDTFGAPRYAGGYHTHKGTDIMCARDTPIVAVVSGVISRANPFDTGLGGITVWLRGDDGNSYYYAHLSSIQTGIKAGARVTPGQVIGFAGNTGDAAGGPVHLHFEIHPGGGAAIDPYLVLKCAAKISDLVTTTTTTTTSTTTTTTDVPMVPAETSTTEATVATEDPTAIDLGFGAETAGAGSAGPMESWTTTAVTADSATIIGGPTATHDSTATTGASTTTGSTTTTTVALPRPPAAPPFRIRDPFSTTT
jgi:murein DD-endopeptidase MepM/ murein hydrolase activator NlpD